MIWCCLCMVPFSQLIWELSMPPGVYCPGRNGHALVHPCTPSYRRSRKRSERRRTSQNSKPQTISINDMNNNEFSPSPFPSSRRTCIILDQPTDRRLGFRKQSLSLPSIIVAPFARGIHERLLAIGRSSTFPSVATYRDGLYIRPWYSTVTMNSCLYESTTSSPSLLPFRLPLDTHLTNCLKRTKISCNFTSPRRANRRPQRTSASRRI